MLAKLKDALARAANALLRPAHITSREAIFREVVAEQVPNTQPLAEQPATQKQENPMSIFTKIESAEHTAAAWIEKELTKLIGEAPTFLQVADATLNYAGPILQTVLAAEGQSAAATEVGKVITEAQTDITVVRAVIADAGAVPSAQGILASIQANLAGLLTANHITNAASVALVTKLLKEFAALLAAFPAPATSTAAA